MDNGKQNPCINNEKSKRFKAARYFVDNNVKKSFSLFHSLIMDKSKNLKWVDIPEDVKLSIFSYLQTSELHSVSATNSESYILASCSFIWKPHFYRIWPSLSTNSKEGYEVRFRDDFHDKEISFRLKHNTLYDDDINMKISHALFGTYPNEMDLSKYSFPFFQSYEMMSTIRNNGSTLKRRMQVYQRLPSATWVEDLCLRSSTPFPTLYPLKSKSFKGFMHNFYLRKFYNRMSIFGSELLRPFVSPFATMIYQSDNHNIIEMNVSPRFVAYYEVAILPRDKAQEPSVLSTISSSSRSTLDCIAVGLSRKRFNIYLKMPGWDHLSYGYHSDDGGVFHNRGDTLRPYGPIFTSGDTVGCGIDYIKQAIFFTLNGSFLGYAWKDVNIDDYEWYPTVGVDSYNPLQINFGNVPFVFDLSHFIVNSRYY